jgi:hypothetical protein
MKKRYDEPLTIEELANLKDEDIDVRISLSLQKSSGNMQS